MGNDKDLIKRLKEGDKLALKQLFDQYYDKITIRLYKMVPDLQLAEDLVQEVFISLWNKRKALAIHSSVFSYLMVSARNRLFTHLRNKKHEFVEIQEFHFGARDSQDPHKKMEESELERKVRLAIDELPAKSRTIFAMSRFENMSYREIAKQLDVPIKTVEYQISKAIKHLKIRLLTRE